MHTWLLFVKFVCFVPHLYRLNEYWMIEEVFISLAVPSNCFILLIQWPFLQGRDFNCGCPRAPLGTWCLGIGPLSPILSPLPMSEMELHLGHFRVHITKPNSSQFFRKQSGLQIEGEPNTESVSGIQKRCHFVSHLCFSLLAWFIHCSSSMICFLSSLNSLSPTSPLTFHLSVSHQCCFHTSLSSGHTEKWTGFSEWECTLFLSTLVGRKQGNFTGCKHGNQAGPMPEWAVLTSYSDYRGDQLHLHRVCFAHGNVFKGPEYEP